LQREWLQALMNVLKPPPSIISHWLSPEHPRQNVETFPENVHISGSNLIFAQSFKSFLITLNDCHRQNWYVLNEMQCF
jgi:hypothetical protein